MSLPLAPGIWTLDPAHSRVGFGVRHLGISTMHGHFGSVDASLNVAEQVGDSVLQASIDMASVDTGNADRDNHLRSTDFFDAEAHPSMTFTSTGIEGSGNDWTVNGEVSLGGQAQPVTLAVTFNGTEDNPFDGSHRAGFVATGQVDRSALGIDWQVPLSSGGSMLSNTVDLTLDVQLLSPAAD